MARVLIAYPLADPAAERHLERDFEVVRGVGTSRDEFFDLLGDIDGIVVRPPARLDAAALAHAPRLRVIANIGTGLDHIDTTFARHRGIEIVAGAGANARSVAEYVLATMIMAHRRLDLAIDRLRDGSLDWPTRVGALRGHEVGGTLGIVGYGQIGRTLAGMARGSLGLRIAAYDPYAAPDPSEVDVVCASLDELLDASGTVSVHVPLTEATRHLIGRAQLDRLGPDGVLVNSARGGVVDEDAVVAALRAGRLRAAVWDVFEREPPEPARLAELASVPGLILTPHIAGISHEAGSALSWHAVRGVVAALTGPGGAATP